MLMQRLQHPNIVGYKDSFLAKNGEQLCIVMTYCDGGDLSNRVSTRRGRLFSEDQVMHWFVQVSTAAASIYRRISTASTYLLPYCYCQIALGMHFVSDRFRSLTPADIFTLLFLQMHENKVLHRDIKTQNIFLLGNGRLVLGDLGISKVLDGTMQFGTNADWYTVLHVARALSQQGKPEFSPFYSLSQLTGVSCSRTTTSLMFGPLAVCCTSSPR